jgi:hypothetical protein
VRHPSAHPTTEDAPSGAAVSRVTLPLDCRVMSGECWCYVQPVPVELDLSEDISLADQPRPGSAAGPRLHPDCCCPRHPVRQPSARRSPPPSLSRAVGSYIVHREHLGATCESPWTCRVMQ